MIKKSKKLLSVNIDHIAFIRNSRNTLYPDPLYAAYIAEQAGANGITVHLREDRRHINDKDLYILKKNIQTKMNLEIAITNEMIDIAYDIQPDYCCFVPERREEITTEKGLNVIKDLSTISNAINKLKKNNILVSLFIDADKKQVNASLNAGASIIEINTGPYVESKNKISREKEVNKIKKVIKYAFDKGLQVNVGHGLSYYNIYPMLSLFEIHEFNIGHSIISRALFSGLLNAVKDMIKLINDPSLNNN